jgi:hypothetical protein
LLGELIDPPKSNVVAGGLVFGAWVAQAYKESNHGCIIFEPNEKRLGA